MMPECHFRGTKAFPERKLFYNTCTLLTLASVSDCGMNISLSRTIRCCHKNEQVIFKQGQMVNQIEKVSAHLPVKNKVSAHSI